MKPVTIALTIAAVSRLAVCFLVPAMALLVLPSSLSATESVSHETAPGFTLDLAAAVQRGLEMNPALQAGRYRQQAAESRYKASRSEFLPRVTAELGTRRLHNRSDDEYNQDYLDQRTTSYTLRVSQPLFAGFTGLNTWRQAGLDAELEEVRRKMQVLDLTHEIQTLFLELIRVREDLRAANSAVERLENQLDAAQAWFEVDMRPRLGVLQTVAELEFARNKVVAVTNAGRALRARLAALLALPETESVDYDGSILAAPPGGEFTIEEMLTKARANRPDLQYARLSVEQALGNQRLARGQFAPRVSLDVDYTRRDLNYKSALADDLEREHWSIGLNMQWELFSGGRDYYRAQSSGHELASAEADLQNSENQVTAEVRGAMLAYQDASARISGAREALSAAREAFAAAQERYRASLGTTVEVLDTQAQLTAAESELNQTRIARIQALADIYRVAGVHNPNLL